MVGKHIQRTKLVYNKQYPYTAPPGSPLDIIVGGNATWLHYLHGAYNLTHIYKIT